ncbi:MAG: cryptochrome/photolyase family protein [Halobacteria archaeon]|nr:cryptochrome/photolyase family protein [Halobacteria archaeon]
MSRSKQPRDLRRLVVVLGDQLDRNSPLLRHLDPTQDRVFMAEVHEEATHVWSHKARIALFLSAMRHFREDLRARAIPVHYLTLDDHPYPSLAVALAAFLNSHPPQLVQMLRSGDWRVHQALTKCVEQAGLTLETVENPHFLINLDDFQDWLGGRKQPRMEHFYRFMRKRSGILMEGGQPLGGRWNYDAENRGHFGRKGPGLLPLPPGFTPDAITEEVLALVAREFPRHPGELDDFDWPVTPDQAEVVLEDFIAQRLPHFGRYQDAMWTGEPFLYHSLLASSLNLSLLQPSRVITATSEALQAEAAPVAAVEGFIRQVLGWREYVRGIYWTQMPGYANSNELAADRPLPAFFWSGDTDMRCLQAALGQTLRYGYAHHIQRLMITGLYCLLLGVRPQAVHEWYLAVFVDAVEWVELPNTLGMSQYADGGFLASKPYVASGAYINRMSNYCGGCQYDPRCATGKTACPYTTLYWDFLQSHAKRFSKHPRTALQWRNLARKTPSELQAIRRQANQLRTRIC